MANQVSIAPIAPLIAATIFSSMSVIPPGELEKKPATAAQEPTDGHMIQGNAIAADAVNEARWGVTHREYALGASGQIVPAESVIGGTAERALPRLGDGELATHELNHYGGLFPKGMAPECGPSPATPEEIARLVTEAALRHEIDGDFALAIATAESRLDRLRNSPKGARGPMQLMPETAERFGVPDACDPEKNIDGGVRYLRELTDEFRNPLLVAAAYNAGEGRVREHGGIPPFKETVGYVAEVINLQLGLEGSGPVVREKGSVAEEPARRVSGVIATRDRRQWVGGVMHF